MNTRERITACLKHQEPDRTPIFEYVLLSPIADIFLGREYSADPGKWQNFYQRLGFEQFIRQMAIDRIELAEILGHDMMYVSPNPTPDSFKITDDIHIEQPISDDPVRVVAESNKRHLDEDRCFPDEYLIYHFLNEEMSKRGLDIPILAPAYAHGIWTDVSLMQTMVLEPHVATEHFKLATKRSLSRINQYISLGIHQVGIGGDFAGNSLLISPEMYRQFIVPELKYLSDQIHQYGRYAVNASDGNLWPVIDDFLIGSGVDGYLEIDFNAGMDLAKLKNRYGGQICFYGNIDCGNILSFEDEHLVTQHTLKCIQDGLGQGGHIFTASNAITSSVPVKNYITMVNTYRRFFDIPSLSSY